MFSLISGLWEAWTKKTEYNTLIVGLDRAGKTTALEQLKAIFGGLDPLDASKIPPTVGLNIGRLQVNQQSLVFWDLGGASNLRSLWEKYTGEAHALVYVVDASDHARLAESREALHGLLARPELQDVPLLILANKQDAGEALTPHEVESRFDLQQMLATGQPQSVLGCTALNGDGVQEGACWLADVLKERARGESGAARVAIARDLGMGRPSPARSFALRGAAE